MEQTNLTTKKVRRIRRSSVPTASDSAAVFATNQALMHQVERLKACGAENYQLRRDIAELSSTYEAACRTQTEA